MKLDTSLTGQRALPARAVALDGHGVVYSRVREVVDALIDALRTRGWLSTPESEAKSLYLSLQERAFTQKISYEEMLAEFARVLGLPGSDGVKQLHRWVQEFSADIVVDPDLTGVLTELRGRGVKVTMLTNSIHPARVKENWLKKQGIAHLFDLIVSSVDERCQKPDPEIFRRFVAHTGLPSGSTVFIGHDPMEIRGAKAAGMITIGLRCTTPEADYEVQKLSEVLQLPLWPMRRLEKREKEG